MSNQCEHWLQVAANLRVDRSRGIAPHKPLLLLVLAELAETAALSAPVIPLTGELVFRFLTYSTVVAARRPQRADIRLPFYHLHSDGIWTPLDERGDPTTDRNRVAAADFNPEFLACLRDLAFRANLRRVLIAKYFNDPAERAALYALIGLPIPSDEAIKSDAESYQTARDQGREARFRLTVIPAYNYTCALTRYRLTTIDSGTIVDAAHIHQFADSRNNDPRNGIALSKNAHWLFDEGLWSLTDDYRVIVACERFDESGPDAYLLRQIEGSKILLPSSRECWPATIHLDWHRTHKFRSLTQNRR